MRKFVKQIFSKDHNKSSKVASIPSNVRHTASNLPEPYDVYILSGEDLFKTSMFKQFVSDNKDTIDKQRHNNIALYECFKYWFYANYCGFSIPPTASLYYCFYNIE